MYEVLRVLFLLSIFDCDMLKRLLFAAYVLMVVLRVSAQEHAVFLGHPLGGGMDEMVQALEDEGYELKAVGNGIASMTGAFDGVQCILEVHFTPRSRTVHQVSVAFAEFMENDIARMLRYQRIRRILKKKYSSWRYSREKSLDEWSSSYARISLGTRRFPGQGYKTLFVWWQDREGWERLQSEIE